MVNSSAIFSHSQCQWENLVGFIRSFIAIKCAGLQIWHCMLLYKLNEFSFQKVHISQFDCLLDQRESSTHLKVTNQYLLWQHKCVFQFESIAGVLLRIHWKSRRSIFHIFFFTASNLFLDVCKWRGVDHLSVSAWKPVVRLFRMIHRPLVENPILVMEDIICILLTN